MENKKSNNSPLAGQLTAATATNNTAPVADEFSWGDLPTKASGSRSSFDYGFDRFPAPKKGPDGKEQYASKVYTQTYKAVANAMAKYLADLAETAETEAEKAALPVFQRSVIKGPDGKPTGTRVWRIR